MCDFWFFENFQASRKVTFLYEKTHTQGFPLTCINNTQVNYSSNLKMMMVPPLAGKSRDYN